MLTRTLILALFVVILSAAGVRAQEDAKAPASPEAAASPEASPGAPASPGSPGASASPADAPAGDAKELLGSYAFDLDYILEQQPDYKKFTPEQKKAAHDKATADSPKLEIVISADRVKISENGTVKTDASYRLVKKTGTTFALELTDALAREKKADVVNFDLQGTRLKMTKEGDKEDLVWVKTK